MVSSKLDPIPKQLILPSGFQFAGLHSGIKESGQPDMALFHASEPCSTAATYTQNEYRAASILRNEQMTPSDEILAVIVNSGNANACTGELGKESNQEMAERTARQLGIPPEKVLTLSTGIIGQQLPMEKVLPGIDQLVTNLSASDASFLSAAKAILTSDNGMKLDSMEFEAGSRRYHLSGCAKGAGMIGPNMATMLCLLQTDMNISPAELQRLLAGAVGRSFNSISVEGHTSTNDAVILMANRTGPEAGETELLEFEKQLEQMCVRLAKKIPADGEGASHLIEISVAGATSDEHADRIARCVAQSALVKTAITGNDPNWGRVMSAVGNANVPIAAHASRLVINGCLLFDGGQPVAFDEQRASRAMQGSFQTDIEIVVGSGSGQATHWTSDLTVDYVRFNSEYTT